MEPWSPFVTVAIPCLNEEAYIEEFLACVLAQDYPADRLEILIADGGSTDATLAKIAKISERDPRVRVVPNPRRIQAPGLNELIRASRGEVIVRMDVHAVYAPDYVTRCVEVLQETGADNVGGAQRAQAKTWFQQALCAALESPLGVGGSKYRSPENEGFVDTVFNGAFRRRVFETVGLYDPGAITNEDAELNQRIVDAGGKVYLSRKIVTHYFPRTSLSSLATQYYRYGRGRARTLLKHGKFLSVRPAIPFLMVVSGATMAVVPPLQLLLPAALSAYAGATALEAVRVGLKAGPRAVPVVWAIFPVLHVAHGVGFGSGLVHYLRHPDWTEPETIPKAADPGLRATRSPRTTARARGRAPRRAAGRRRCTARCRASARRRPPGAGSRRTTT